MTHAAAAAQIQSASLPAKTERNAWRLLALAGEENGHITLTWPDLCALCDSLHNGAARRHLSRLVQAGIIHYSSNEYIYISFLAWPPADPSRAVSARPRAETARGRAEDEPDADPSDEAPARGRAETARGRAETARGRAEKNAYKELMFVCLFVDPTTPLSEIINKQTDKQRSAYELLIDPDIAIEPLIAADLAAGYTLEDIQRQTWAWLRDMDNGRVTSAGALINRIRSGFSARSVSAEDQQSALWLRHFTAYSKWSNYGEYDHLIRR